MPCEATDPRRPLGGAFVVGNLDSVPENGALDELFARFPDLPAPGPFEEAPALQPQVKVTERRTILDVAHCLKDLVDVHFRDAEVIRLVMDQLNTHRLAVLYEVFDPSEARRIARKLEVHHTPKHGSWLDMAEIELAVLNGQCLDRRLPDIATVRTEVAAWERRRNEAKATIDWRFTAPDARNKLDRLYPT